MSERELYDLLGTITIPVAYDHFEEDITNIKPPFILYRNTDTTTLFANDKVFVKNNQYIIDLITDKKDVVLEGQLEKLLEDNSLPYDKMEDYLPNERIYQIRFFI